MNEPIVVAWVGVALTIIVQGAAVAFFMGTLNTKVSNTKKELDSHLEKEVPQAHGCEAFRFGHKDTS